MDLHVAELKNILTDELNIYRELLSLGKDKTKLLVDRKLTELQSTIEKEENLVQQLIELEPLLQENFNIIVGEPVAKLDILVEKVPDKDLKAEFIDLGSKLREVVEELKAVNEGNQRLAQVGLDVAQHTIKIMTRAPKPVTYGPGGGSNSTQNSMRGRSLFDSKA